MCHSDPILCFVSDHEGTPRKGDSDRSLFASVIPFFLHRPQRDLLERVCHRVGLRVDKRKLLLVVAPRVALFAGFLHHKRTYEQTFQFASLKNNVSILYKITFHLRLYKIIPIVIFTPKIINVSDRLFSKKQSKTK